MLLTAVSSVHLRFYCYGEGRSSKHFHHGAGFFLGEKKEPKFHEAGCQSGMPKLGPAGSAEWVVGVATHPLPPALR